MGGPPAAGATGRVGRPPTPWPHTGVTRVLRPDALTRFLPPLVGIASGAWVTANPDDPDVLLPILFLLGSVVFTIDGMRTQVAIGPDVVRVRFWFRTTEVERSDIVGVAIPESVEDGPRQSRLVLAEGSHVRTTVVFGDPQVEAARHVAFLQVSDRAVAEALQVPLDTTRRDPRPRWRRADAVRRDGHVTPFGWALLAVLALVTAASCWATYVLARAS